MDVKSLDYQDFKTIYLMILNKAPGAGQPRPGGPGRPPRGSFNRFRKRSY